MQYQKPTFTLPTNTKKMTEEAYEIAVGLRCAVCKKLNPHKCKGKND